MKQKPAERVMKLAKENTSIHVRKIVLEEGAAYILYLPEITDTEKLSDKVIKPLMHYKGGTKLTVDKAAFSVIFAEELSVEEDWEDIPARVLEGRAVIVLNDEERYIAVAVKKAEKRSISMPEVQGAIKAPRDAFNESLDSNLSLLRSRLKDPALAVDYFILGKRTRTKVAVLYIKDVANPGYVKDISQKLKNIKIDGILESGYLQKLLLSGTLNLLPRAGIAERADAAGADILDGKICILVDGSNLALIVPKILVEYLDSGDDHYENMYFSIFSKLLRLAALAATLTLSSIYVVVVAFRADLLPARYILALAASRMTVPVNAFLEAFLMELIAELLREASIRLPKQIGPAIGIVGTIVIGQAAVAAGLVSPLLVIIIALSTMSSFAVPDISIINPVRVLKFAMLAVSGMFGLTGLTLGLTAVMISLVSAESFGVPYAAPIAPFNFKDLKKYISSDIRVSKTRPGYIRTPDKKRQP